MWQLVAYRIVQGLGGGALQPTAQAILFESYPPEKRSGAMAIFGLGAMVGPAIGPTLGGYFVDNFSWPLIFFINLPIGIAAFVMTLAYIKDQTYVKRSTNPVDWIGLGLLIAGVGSLQYVLERGQIEDWFSSQTIVVMTIISAVAIVAFIIRQLRDEIPLVDLSVFRSRSFTAGNIIGVVSGFGLFGSALMMPLYYQNVMGFTAMGTGLALLPGAIATAVSLPLAGRIAKWVDQRIVIAFGLGTFALGCWLVGNLNQQADFNDTLLPRAIQGFALGFMWVPVTTAMLGDISRAKMAGATGVSTLVRQLGGSLGIAILQLIETRDARFRLRRARVGNHDGEPSRGRPAARRGQSERGAGQRVRHGDAQRRNDRLQRRLPHLRGRVRAVDSLGAALAWKTQHRRRAARGTGRVI